MRASKEVTEGGREGEREGVRQRERERKREVFMRVCATRESEEKGRGAGGVRRTEAGDRRTVGIFLTSFMHMHRFLERDNAGTGLVAVKDIISDLTRPPFHFTESDALHFVDRLRNVIDTVDGHSDLFHNSNKPRANLSSPRQLKVWFVRGAHLFVLLSVYLVFAILNFSILRSNMLVGELLGCSHHALTAAAHSAQCSLDRFALP